MKNRAPLLVVALSLITLSVFFNRVTQGFDPRPSGGLSVQTHADVAPHSPNLQSFGDYHAEATMDDAGRVEVHFYDLKASQLMPPFRLDNQRQGVQILLYALYRGVCP